MITFKIVPFWVDTHAYDAANVQKQFCRSFSQSLSGIPVFAFTSSTNKKNGFSWVPIWFLGGNRRHREPGLGNKVDAQAQLCSYYLKTVFTRNWILTRCSLLNFNVFCLRARGLYVNRCPLNWRNQVECLVSRWQVRTCPITISLSLHFHTWVPSYRVSLTFLCWTSYDFFIYQALIYMILPGGLLRIWYDTIKIYKKTKKSFRTE